MSTQTTTSTTSETTRKRGRPRKGTSSVAKPAKKKRGRPKGYSPKIASQGFNEKLLKTNVEEVMKKYFQSLKLDVQVNIVPAKRRGRPSKS